MVLTRADILRTFALNEVSDDYENFERIEKQCRILGAKCNLTFASSEVSEALAHLIKNGLVKSFWLSTRGPAREIEGVPIEADLPRAYFFQTEEGKLVHAANFWPFDDSDQLRADVSIQ